MWIIVRPRLKKKKKKRNSVCSLEKSFLYCSEGECLWEDEGIARKKLRERCSTALYGMVTKEQAVVLNLN